MDLENMKYADLQKLAKSYGIKGNQKSNKLIEALKELLPKAVNRKSSEKSGNVNQGMDKKSQSNVLQEINNEKCSVYNSLDDSYAMFSKNYMARKRNSKNSFTEDNSTVGSTEQTVDEQKSQKENVVIVESLNAKENEILRKESAKKNKSKAKRGTFESNLNVENNSNDHPANVVDGQNGAEGKVKRSSGAKRNKMADEISSSTQKSSDKSVEDQVRIDLEVVANDNVNNNNDNESDQLMKKRLRSSYDKTMKVESHIAKPESHIPKLNTKHGKIDWSKIHQKQFDKMDSIDDYQKKKEERKLQLFGSPMATSTAIKQRTATRVNIGKNVPAGTKESHKKMTNSNGVVKNSKKSVINKKIKETKRTSSRFMSPQSFKPQVLSTKNVDFNFVKLVSDNKLTAPSKCPTSASEAAKEQVSMSGNTRSKTRNVVCKPQVRGHSPRKSMRKFPFSPKPLTICSALSTTTSQQPTRQKFDLVASLEKPLTWIPYSGKVKPLDTHEEEPMKYLKSKIVASLRDKSLKEVKIKTIVDKRAEAKLTQKEKRFNEQMLRRTNRS